MRILQIGKADSQGDTAIPEITDLDSNWIEVKRFRCNRRNELYSYREKTRESYLVLDGIVYVDGQEYTAGTILSYDPGERRNFFVIKDATVLSIKDPALCADDELREGALTLDVFVAPYQCALRKEDKGSADIGYDEISVVIQGAIDKEYTPLSVQSVRRFLPGARIILSTWEDTDVTQIDYDEVVFNKDPGAPFFDKVNGSRHYDNRNRLLVSTQGGVARATTKYTLKMRSDCILAGDGIVRNYGRYPKKTNELCLFKNKLVVGEQCNIMKLLFSDSCRPYVFHVSDWFCFGLTEDVQSYFIGTEIETAEQMTAWHYKNDLYIPPDDIMGRSASPRYNSEQYYFLSALRRKFDIPYEDASDYSEEIERMSRVAIINNFEIVNIRDHEVINAKKQNKQAWNLEDSKNAEFFTNTKYEKYYHELTDNAVQGN